MRKVMGWAAVLAATLSVADVAAQGNRSVVRCQAGPTAGRQTTGAAAARQAPGPTGRAAEYDVVLDIPNLCVDRVRLNVNNLQARVALDARVANLVRVNAGADVQIAEVNLGIDGVRAQALLLVDLDNVVQVVERALAFIDANPQIITQLTGTVNNTVNTVGGVANTALQPGGPVSGVAGTVGQTLNSVTQPGGLLSQTVNTLGQTVTRTLDASGNIVEQTLDTTGGVAGSRVVGSLLTLPVLRQTAGQGGQIVRQVRDQTGAVIEFTLDAAGRLVGSRVLSQGRRTGSRE
jgi:hypothetical protein